MRRSTAEMTPATYARFVDLKEWRASFASLHRYFQPNLAPPAIQEFPRTITGIRRETGTVPDPLPLLKELNPLAHELDPGPTTLATCCEGRLFAADVAVPITAAVTDLSGANRYFGWYYDKPSGLGLISMVSGTRSTLEALLCSQGNAQDINTNGIVTFDHKYRKDPYFCNKANRTATPAVHINSRLYTERGLPG